MPSTPAETLPRPLRRLVWLNAGLLLVLTAVVFTPVVGAQAFRPAGEYVMVGATLPGLPSDAVFIVDEVNEQMVVVGFDPNTKTINGVASRDLAADLAARRARD